MMLYAYLLNILFVYIPIILMDAYAVIDIDPWLLNI